MKYFGAGLITFFMTVAIANADTPPTTQADRDQAIQLLHLAIEQYSLVPEFKRSVSLLPTVARGQAEARDLDGLRKTADLLEKAYDATKLDETIKKAAGQYNEVKLAGCFALAGDLETYRTIIAKHEPVPKGLVMPMAQAYAEAHDYERMQKILNGADTAYQRIMLCDWVGLDISQVDPAEAKIVIKQAQLALGEKYVPAYAVNEVVSALCEIGDADDAFLEAGKLSGNDLLGIYESLADHFEKLGNHEMAKKANDLFFAAIAKAPPDVLMKSGSDLFYRQIKMGDLKSAGESLNQLRASADALTDPPQKGEADNLKASEYVAAAMAAARLGKSDVVKQCLKDASEHGHLGEYQALQDAKDADKTVEPGAEFLAVQGKSIEAVAAVCAIKDYDARTGGLKRLLEASAGAGDVETAMAALEKMEDRDMRIGSGIPAVARLLVNGQHSQTPIDPVKWVKNLPDPQEQATAAANVALALLARGR